MQNPYDIPEEMSVLFDWMDDNGIVHPLTKDRNLVSWMLTLNIGPINIWYEIQEMYCLADRNEELIQMALDAVGCCAPVDGRHRYYYECEPYWDGFDPSPVNDEINGDYGVFAPNYDDQPHDEQLFKAYCYWLPPDLYDDEAYEFHYEECQNCN